MNKVLASFEKFIFFTTLVVLLSGGWIFTFQNVKVDLSTLAPFPILLLLFSLKKESWTKKQSLEIFDKLKKISNLKSTLYLLFFFFGLLFLAHTLKQWGMQTNAFDQTFLHQPLFYPFERPGMKCDLCYQGIYLAEHFSPSLYLFSPITSILKLDESVFFLQNLLLILSLFFLIRYGPVKKIQSLWIYTALFLASLRALRDPLLWDFREDLAAFFFLSLSLVFYKNRNILLFVLSSLLALYSKENVFAVTFAFSIGILLDGWITKQKKCYSYGSLLLLLSIVSFYLIFTKFIPELTAAHNPRNNIVFRMSEFGSTPFEIVKGVFLNPILAFQILVPQILQKSTFKYLLYLLGPFLFFIHRKNWIWLIPVSAVLAMNLLSSAEPQRSISYHYHLMAMPFLILIFLEGVKNFENKPKKLLFGLCIALILSGRWPGYEVSHRISLALENAKTAWSLRSLPQDEPALAWHKALAQLSHLKELGEFHYPDIPPTGTFDLDFSLLEKINPKLQNTKTIVIEIGNPEDPYHWLDWLQRNREKLSFQVLVIHPKS